MVAGGIIMTIEKKQQCPGQCSGISICIEGWRTVWGDLQNHWQMVAVRGCYLRLNITIIRYSFAGCLAGWLPHSFIHSFSDSFIYSFVLSFPAAHRLCATQRFISRYFVFFFSDFFFKSFKIVALLEMLMLLLLLPQLLSLW